MYYLRIKDVIHSFSDLNQSDIVKVSGDNIVKLSKEKKTESKESVRGDEGANVTKFQY